MTGLDTNILVRYIMQDDPAQSPKAARMIERRLTPEAPGFISLATMLETTWVLANVFGLSNRQIALAIERMLQTTTFVIQNEREVHSAMMILESGHGSFDDALIAALGLWAGCTSTLTLDRKASRLPGFELIA